MPLLVLGYVAAAADGSIGAIEDGLAGFMNCKDDNTCEPRSGGVNYGAVFIPAVGPFIELGQPALPGAQRAFMVVDGVAQLGGVALIISGLAWPASRDSAVAPVLGPGRVGFAATF